MQKLKDWLVGSCLLYTSTNEQLNPNVSKAEKLKDIKANRAKEKAIQREKESLISSGNNNEKLADVIKLTNISDEDNTCLLYTSRCV